MKIWDTVWDCGVGEEGGSEKVGNERGNALMICSRSEPFLSWSSKRNAYSFGPYSLIILLFKCLVSQIEHWACARPLSDFRFTSLESSAEEKILLRLLASSCLHVRMKQLWTIFRFSVKFEMEKRVHKFMGTNSKFCQNRATITDSFLEYGDALLRTRRSSLNVYQSGNVWNQSCK
jgi:hypothetical protein